MTEPQQSCELLRLRRYEYRGKGLAMNAVIVVLAPNSVVALRLAEEAMRNSALSPRTLSLRSHSDINHINLVGEPQVIYFWHGDY